MAAPDHASSLYEDPSCAGRGVHTCPCGTPARQRSPRGARPRRLAIFVDKLVSSTNTS